MNTDGKYVRADGSIENLKGDAPLAAEKGQTRDAIGQRRLAVTGEVILEPDGEELELGMAFSVDVVGGPPAHLILARATDDKIMLKPDGFVLDKPVPRRAYALINGQRFDLKPGTKSCLILLKGDADAEG